MVSKAGRASNRRKPQRVAGRLADGGAAMGSPSLLRCHNDALQPGVRLPGDLEIRLPILPRAQPERGLLGGAWEQGVCRGAGLPLALAGRLIAQHQAVAEVAHLAARVAALEEERPGGSNAAP